MNNILKYITIIINVLIFNTLIASGLLALEKSSLDIFVDAGEDFSICPEGNLNIADLGATITGDVSDGMWFVMGDGAFLPGNTNKLRYSVATTYVPGPEDITNGGFTLMLVSDDPDGDGHEVEVTDTVNISFQGSPTLACNQLLNVSLNTYCEQVVTPQMVLANPDPPYSRYQIELRDAQNRLIVDNILTIDHIGQTINAWVTHSCAYYSSCEAMIMVSDKSPPRISCQSDTLPCTASILPDSIGFPVDTQVVLTMIAPQTYVAVGLDGCTNDAELTYQDEVVEYACSSYIDRLIKRTWRAVDEYENAITCIQEIYLRKDSIQGVELPPNYDDITLPIIECSDLFPTTEKGYPAPSYTGSPNVQSCSNLEATFDDTEFPNCGASYKILRRWLIIDWCTFKDITHNQVIKVGDHQAPVIKCSTDTIVYSDPYSCFATNIPIPPLLSIADCSEYTIQYQLRDSTGWLLDVFQGSVVPRAPVGKNYLAYIAIDACGNKDTCEIILEVIDNEHPIAICDDHTTVTLTSDGHARLFAESIDDGSYDNCEIHSMEVLKMNPLCPEYQDRGPFIDFCCVEGGSRVLVAMIVTDIYGNENSCMVEVEVEDKLAPKIYCPSDLTISCRTEIDVENLEVFGSIVQSLEAREDISIYDYFNQGIVGIDGYIDDNCEADITSTFRYDIECYTGVLNRDFTATDPSGLTNTCVQRIAIEDENPLEYDDIIWPDIYHDETCVDTSISPEISGVPYTENDLCADLNISYKDQFFPLTEGACMKIIRKWTVIDWCRFDQQTQEGIWEYNQVMKFENSIAPSLSVVDTIVCLYDEECASTFYQYDIQTTDDCTSPDDLEYSWRIENNESPTAPMKGSSRTIEAALSPGIHRVYVEVEDRCGNYVSDDYEIVVEDCKAPTPHCITSLTTVLMHNNSMVTIKARDFDFNSYDNCTAEDDLLFSFSKNTQDSIREITCANIPNGISEELTYEMWVTDEKENQEYCQIHIVVQDNNNNCDDQLEEIMIQGEITSLLGSPVDNTTVEFEALLPENSRSEITNSAGQYELSNLSTESSGMLLPRRNDNHSLGVSTLDIVKLQRHILGKAVFDDAYKYIAGDVNGSGKLSGVDILIMRKLILGIYDVLPEGVTSWKFYDVAKSINMVNALSTSEGKEIEGLSERVNVVNFRAVKIGDVDDSWNELSNVTMRSSPVNLVYAVEGNEVYVSSKEWIDGLNGYQLELQLPAGAYIEQVKSDLPGFSEENYMILDDHIVRISWNGEINLEANTDLFVIYTDEEVDHVHLRKDYLAGEAYIELNAFPLQLQKEEQSDQELTLSILQNPFRDQCMLQIEGNQEVKAEITIYDTGGHRLWNKNVQVQFGIQHIPVYGDVLDTYGPMVLVLQTATKRISRKIIRVR